jgi:predicted MPP superfamily phosphohydrolase
MAPTPRLSRRRFLRLGASLLAGAAGVGYYAWRVEPHWVEVVSRELPIANLPDALVGRTLVQLSDLHVGQEVDDDFLLDSFALVEPLEPAFVAVTGDFMTSREDEEVDHALRIVERLPRGTLGTLAVLGNHDYGNLAVAHEAGDRLARGLGEQGIDVLRNRRSTVAGLTFVGIDDYWGPYFAPRRALAGLSREAPAVVLCHNPDAADQPGWGDYQGWILAGHTHGGQCKLPFFRPPRLSVENPRYVAGEVDLGDGRRLYINRALGHLMQVRFNVRPEITVFRLTRGESSLV